MKKTILLCITGAALAMASTACIPTSRTADAPPPQFYVRDCDHWLGIECRSVITHTSLLDFDFVVSGEYSSDSFILIDEALYYGGRSVDKLTNAEAFAYEKIKSRFEELKEIFYSRRKEIQDITTESDFDDLYWWSLMRLTTAYMKEVPIITADKTLFGIEPGEDLSSHFVCKGTAAFKTIGPEYKAGDSYNPNEIKNRPYRSVKEYFSQGTVIPQMIEFITDGIPEELGSGERITLTFTFPVVVEHYWSWLLELYDNPDAVERFSEEDWTVTVKLNE